MLSPLYRCPRNHRRENTSLHQHNRENFTIGKLRLFVRVANVDDFRQRDFFKPGIQEFPSFLLIPIVFIWAFQGNTFLTIFQTFKCQKSTKAGRTHHVCVQRQARRTYASSRLV